MKLKLFRPRGPLTITNNRSFHRQQRQVEEEEEDPATQPSVDFQKPTAAVCLSTRKRRVNIRLEENVAYANTSHCKEECHDLWYNKDELRRFRQVYFRDQIVNLRTDEKTQQSNPHTWAKSAVHIYEGFCQSHEAQGLATQALQDFPDMAVTAATLGLERRAVAKISVDTKARRRRLHAIVVQPQGAKNHHIYDYDYHAKQLGIACRAITLPSRLFAHHIALIAAPCDL